MRRSILALLAPLLLAGCMSAAEVAAADDHRCQSYGFKLGSEGYADCRLELDRRRAAQAEAARDRMHAEQLGQMYPHPYWTGPAIGPTPYYGPPGVLTPYGGYDPLRCRQIGARLECLPN